jgi:prepilin peptidase CpaA
MSPWLSIVCAIVVAAIAAATDLRSGRIPNWLTFPAMLLGLAISGIGRGIPGLVVSLLGLVICAAVPFIVYRASDGRGIGGGDIKLFSAFGALLGPTHGLEVEMASFVLVGGYALFRLTFQGNVTRLLTGTLRVMLGLFVPKLRAGLAKDEIPLTTMRMGPAILFALASVLALPYILRWVPWLG